MAEYTFDGFVLTQFVPGDIVLSGYDRGIVTVPNSRYHMNGDVRVADGELAGLLGGSVHMSGDIVWGDGDVYPLGAPPHAPGVFRVNCAASARPRPWAERGRNWGTCPGGPPRTWSNSPPTVLRVRFHDSRL